MSAAFAGRMAKTPRSFIREMLKVTARPEVISFAGGLPHPKSFPVAAVASAAQAVLSEDGAAALQYQESEGFGPLRRYISERYRTRQGLEVPPETVLITSGSQQGLDLLGKVFLDRGDRVVLERPAYLGTIQAWSLYEPEFVHVPLSENGVDVGMLREALAAPRAKLFHAVPNFQNPSGVTYGESVRREVAAAVRDSGAYLVEDDPYFELRFAGRDLPSMREYLPERTILMGTFSKTVSPGLRTGWLAAPREVTDKLVVAKQASDLHSDSLSQRVLCRYLSGNDVAAHISHIRGLYGAQRDAMVAAIERHCPREVRFTRPEGGMFLWMTLPEGVSSLELFDRAIAENVAFVPGLPFYTDGGGYDTLRLNFSNSDADRIDEGIRRLGRAIGELVAKG